MQAQLLPPKIDPPLGLFWGESQKEIEEKSPRITERAVVMQRDAWTVNGFPDEGLKKAIHVEVELQYEGAWTFDDYQRFFASARTKLKALYGDPIVLAR